MWSSGRHPNPVTLLALLVFSAMLLSSCTSTVRFSSKSPPTRDKRATADIKTPDNPDSGALPDTEPVPTKLTSVLTSFLGTPYRWGGTTRAGIDCSGLVCTIFRELGDVALPHDARLMHKLGRKISLAKVRPGDLIFFSTGYWRGVNHVGIYTGNGRFVHASTKLGVIESSMDDGYYRSRFVEARRLIK